jgi:magnesium and cobalt transporter
MDNESKSPSLLDRLSVLLLRQPEDREQLLRLLHDATERELLDGEAMSIIEGALQVSDIAVRDIMVPQAQMDVVDIASPWAEMIAQVVSTAHSRFPVIGSSRDDIVGILLAKDLLRLQHNGGHPDLRSTLRPAVFVPESKRLNVLLREFRASRNHMAIVVDEYGGVAGLVTIEDVLEQIVGDIDDEYDFDESADHIVLDNTGRYRVKATTPMAAFDRTFDVNLADDSYDTVGGLVSHQLGRVPRRNEVLTISGLRIQVLRADSRRVHTLLVDAQPSPVQEPSRSS